MTLLLHKTREILKLDEAQKACVDMDKHGNAVDEEEEDSPHPGLQLLGHISPLQIEK